MEKSRKRAIRATAALASLVIILAGLAGWQAISGPGSFREVALAYLRENPEEAARPIEMSISRRNPALGEREAEIAGFLRQHPEAHRCLAAEPSLAGLQESLCRVRVELSDLSIDTVIGVTIRETRDGFG